MKTETVTTPVFTVWKFAGKQFLAAPCDGGAAIISEAGEHFGSWLSVESFRARQAGKKDATGGEPSALPLGSGEIIIRHIHTTFQS